jgi:hypothetical protein
VIVVALAIFAGERAIGAAERSAEIEAALKRAGDNRGQIEKALDDVPLEHRAGMEFLVENMPDRDLASLSAEFLLANVHFAYVARDKAPWKDSLPEDVFLNNVLPYASVNERRDDWRKDFYERFMPLVKDARTPTEAAVILNKQAFGLLDVRYSTERRKPDQSPYESIEAKTASCTGLSVLLIDACRAVGVPARFVGTPLWADKSGNHSWVEIWDDGWHFTGACEPSGDVLDSAWFEQRASEAKRDDPLHAIYASSFQRTPQTFPLVWDRSIDYVHAVNVTDRYVERGKKLPEGMVAVMFRALDREGGKRKAASLKITDADGKVVFEGKTNDERFDANDHLTVPLMEGTQYEIDLRLGDEVGFEVIVAEKRDAPLTFILGDANAEDGDNREGRQEREGQNDTECGSGADEYGDDKREELREAAADSPDPLASLQEYLAIDAEKRPLLADQPFAAVPLSRADAARAQSLLWDDHVTQIRLIRAAEMEARELTDGELKMPFFYKTFGDKPAGGRSLYISMHGGGGAPKQVNDGQWENQKRLYELKEGVYAVPRAPTDTWNLWHQDHIDRLFDRLIENMIVFEDVDPNRVYILGFSAGGDGVYQLAPRYADRLAAAAMMAGHPNEASPLGLRNLPFIIQVGADDTAYNRNKVAAEWGAKLAELNKADPEGYVHLVKIYEGKGHWLDREDAMAIPWMARYERRTLPKRVVWHQDDVTHTRFYWLAVEPGAFHGRALVTATRDGQTIDVKATDVDRLIVRLNDDMLDMDKPVSIISEGKQLFSGPVARSIAVLAKTLAERGDPKSIFSGEVRVDLRGGSE